MEEGIGGSKGKEGQREKCAFVSVLVTREILRFDKAPPAFPPIRGLVEAAEQVTRTPKRHECRLKSDRRLPVPHSAHLVSITVSSAGVPGRSARFVRWVVHA